MPLVGSMFFSTNMVSEFAVPGGIVTDPTATVGKGTNIRFSFKMLTNLVFQNYDMGQGRRANIKTAYSKVSIIQFDRLEPSYTNPYIQWQPLYDVKKIVFDQKTDIGKPQPRGLMNFSSAKTVNFSYSASVTGMYALLFELFDLTQNGADREENGNYAYYGIQNVTYNY